MFIIIKIDGKRGKKMSVIEIKENEFFEKIKEGKVVVDCYADWCGPCRMFAPIVSEAAEEIKDCHFYKINIDEAEEIAQKYAIMSIPTLLLFSNGELKNTIIGMRSKEDIQELVEKL